MATANESDYYEVAMVHQAMRAYVIINARVACNNLTKTTTGVCVYVYMCVCCVCVCIHFCVQENF